MTQAFNLSQLANNLNTSGQLDATDGLTGEVPLANLPTITVAKGGTGQNTLSANAVLLGNGTSGVQTVAPSTSGNVLTSNGTTWVSSAPTSSAPTTAQVLSALSGITDCTAVGGFLLASFSGSSGYNINATLAGSSLRPCFLYTDGSSMYTTSSSSALSGTWRQLAWSNTSFGFAGTAIGIWLRIS